MLNIESVIHQYIHELSYRKERKCKPSEMLEFYGRVYQCHYNALTQGTQEQYLLLEQILDDIQKYIKGTFIPKK